MNNARLNRREFIAMTATTMTGSLVMPRASRLHGDKPPEEAAAHDHFAHGVASGDPLADGFIIWTRVTVSPEAVPGSGLGESAAVNWEVSTNVDFTDVVASGQYIATSETDHTVKVDVRGLDSERTYHYRFSVASGRNLPVYSPVGRVRTFPGSGLKSARFGVCSCANYEAGYFLGYREMARREDIEFVIHLGDYTYEYQSGYYVGAFGTTVRETEPRDLTTELSQFRARLGHYRKDPDLAELHAAKAMICIWDDHEAADNNWRDGATGTHMWNAEAYHPIKTAALAAYLEWMPIRSPHTAAEVSAYRIVKYADLFNLIIPDLRSFRDIQLSKAWAVNRWAETDFHRGLTDSNRTMMGREQFEWFLAQLRSSSTRWQFVGSSVMFSPLTLPAGLDPQLASWLEETLGIPPEGLTLSADQWDGYLSERREITKAIFHGGKGNTIFLAGDIHSSWASEMPVDPLAYRRGDNNQAAAVEFVAPSITANGGFEIITPQKELSDLTRPLLRAGEDGLRHLSPWIKWLDLEHHGFMVIDVSADQVQSEWVFFDNVLSLETPAWWGRGFRVMLGEAAIDPVGGPLDSTSSAFI